MKTITKSDQRTWAYLDTVQRPALIASLEVMVKELRERINRTPSGNHMALRWNYLQLYRTERNLFYLKRESF